MEKEGIIKKIKKVILKTFNYLIISLIIFNAMIIWDLHCNIPFFPVLFLFDFCFIVGYPLFLRYVLKKKWFECTKDDYLTLKYISVPWLILETILIIYYHNETLLIL